jgi:acyl-coenzyme A thioesterase PaaI-like protein
MLESVLVEGAARGAGRSAVDADVLRTDAAGALRSLAHAFVAHDLDPALLTEIVGTTERWCEQVAERPLRSRSVEEYLSDVTVPVRDDGEVIDHFAECPLSGPANPFAIVMSAHREGDEAVIVVRLGPGHEGVPGRSHGGVVAALLDEVNGFVTSMLAIPAVTGELVVRYHEPTPIGEEIELRGRVVSRVGRKVVIECWASSGGTRLASATAVQVLVDPVVAASRSAEAASGI